MEIWYKKKKNLIKNNEINMYWFLQNRDLPINKIFIENFKTIFYEFLGNDSESLKKKIAKTFIKDEIIQFIKKNNNNLFFYKGIRLIFVIDRLYIEYGDNLSKDSLNFLNLLNEILEKRTHLKLLKKIKDDKILNTDIWVEKNYKQSITYFINNIKELDLKQSINWEDLEFFNDTPIHACVFEKLLKLNFNLFSLLAKSDLITPNILEKYIDSEKITTDTLESIKNFQTTDLENKIIKMIERKKENIIKKLLDDQKDRLRIPENIELFSISNNYGTITYVITIYPNRLIVKLTSSIKTIEDYSSILIFLDKLLKILNIKKKLKLTGVFTEKSELVFKTLDLGQVLEHIMGIEDVRLIFKLKYK